MRKILGKAISRKAIMFTVIAVLVSALVLATFFTYYSVPLDVNVDNSKLRIQLVDRYLGQLDSYLSGMLHASGTETLRVTIDVMEGNNSFLGNYSDAFRSCMLTGKLRTPWAGDVDCPGSTYFAGRVMYLENFSREKLNIAPNITLESLTLRQDSPWRLAVTLNYTIEVNDSYAYWKVQKSLTEYIDTDGLEDPTYSIVDPDLAAVKYRMNVSPSDVYSWTEQPSTAHNLTLNRRYFAWDGAPDFLGRLSNDSSPSPNGIVSIVSPDFVDESQIIGPGPRSSLDFLFWKDVYISNISEYGRYNFWAAGVTPTDRLLYGINSTNPGLNGTIVPLTITYFMNMSDPKYIEAAS
jgi:hypothetical protein